MERFIFSFFALTIFLIVLVFVSLGFSQVDLAEQAYAIFEQNCLNCHGEYGSFTEEIIIDHTLLLETGAVVPRNPLASAVYTRLLEKDLGKRMPLGQPELSPAAINTIRRWILAGAPDWRDTIQPIGAFITPKQMLESIEKHVNSLPSFDRPFARYFTLTHLYNAGETPEALHAYQRALSKLVNSLSWGREISNPEPINAEETLFYIDLRDYEWEIGINRWTQIEAVYPYALEFNAPTQTFLRNKLANLRQQLDCEVPFVDVDWFLATASLPPLYHDILDLPLTDRALETRLEVNVVENIRNAAGRRVWRAGFNESGVSNHNRVVERHLSRYGAYWKSYDFAGSVETQNVFRHPLSFEHDGGEIIFNLPNGLQAYYLADAGGNRLDAAPINIVSNPAASDPTVRNGLSCIGCHTKGMKTFEDQVRASIQQKANPPFNKARALRLYVEKTTMDALVDEDTDRYRQALEKTGGVFGGIEPIQRFYEVFQGPVNTAHAAAAVGLPPQVLVRKIRGNTRLENLLGSLVVENGNVKRDTWTQEFRQIVFALDFPEKSVATPVDQQTERIPGESVYIPDPNLRAAIAEILGKASTDSITAQEMATLTDLHVESRGVRDLTGTVHAKNLRRLDITNNQISDLSPLVGLIQLDVLTFDNNQVSDLTPVAHLGNLQHINFANNQAFDLSALAGLKHLESMHVSHNGISDLSPLTKLSNLRFFHSWNNPLSDLSPLVKLEVIDLCGGHPDIATLTGAANLRELYLQSCNVSDLSPLVEFTNLERLNLDGNDLSDISLLAKLTSLTWLSLEHNSISDVSPLSELTHLTWLRLNNNSISDISPLSALTKLTWINLEYNAISDFSPLDGLPETTSILKFSNPGSPLQSGPKIEGPWLWMIVPTGDIGGAAAATSNIDFLAEISDGTTTEVKVATNGAIEGNSVADRVWVSHKISAEGENNINDMANETQLGSDDINNHVAYGVVILESPQEQNTTMLVGSDDAVKVWLNGEMVHNNPIDRAAENYQDIFPVTLQPGANILLVAVYERDGGWSGFFGFEEGTEYRLSNAKVAYIFSQKHIHVGDTFTLDIRTEDVHDLAGWQFDVAFDPTRLEALEINEGDFLKTANAPTFFKKGSINNRTGKITGLSAARLSGDGVSGIGTLLSITFLVKATGETQLTLDNFELGSISGSAIPAGPHETIISIEGQLATGDVNRDGQVTILDLIIVSKHLGENSPANPAVDVNGDGTVTILDLIAVSQNLGKSINAASPQAIADVGSRLNTVKVQAWIQQARIENDGSVAFQRGIANLQRLLALLIPDKTTLLANYPNPFNPETWIPYQLAKPAEVTLRIYGINGQVVRTLALGHQVAGMYQSKSRAAYWDGRNEFGEPVASGVYFYSLIAGDFTATRKMLILK